VWITNVIMHRDETSLVRQASTGSYTIGFLSIGGKERRGKIGARIHESSVKAQQGRAAVSELMNGSIA
jgi:hypothetical protein